MNKNMLPISLAFLVAVTSFADPGLDNQWPRRQSAAATEWERIARWWERLSVSELRSLIAAGADVNAKGSDGEPPLLQAVSSVDRVEIVKELLAAGADPNGVGVGYRNQPVLVWACSNDRSADVIAALLDGGADVNGGEYWTPLLVAMANSTRPEVIRLLLSRGASVTPNGVRENALSQVLSRIKPGPVTAILGILLEFGVDLASPPPYYLPVLAVPIDRMTLRGVPEAYDILAVMNFLIEHGADPNEPAQSDDASRGVSTGSTALHILARRPYCFDTRSVAIANLLLDGGADPALRDRHGATALDIAVTSGAPAEFRLALAQQEQSH